MANWSDLKSSINSVIKTNGSQEITGQVLQNVLNTIVSTLGENATFAGIATPATNPGVPDGNVFYLATEAGTYANFSGIEIATGEAVILEWRGSWKKKTTGFATLQQLSELQQYAGTFTILRRPTDLNTIVKRGAYPLKIQTSENGYTNAPSSLNNNDTSILIVYENEASEGFAKGGIIYQMLIINGSNICTRACISGSWSKWNTYKPYEDSPKEFSCNLVRIFRTIGVIGDSLASGQGRINSMSSFKDFYEFSWPQCIAKELNVTVHNFTKSGLTTRSWLTDSMGYPLMSDGEHNCACYIIALGANDVGLGESYLGSPSDIDLENFENNKDTYYGNYAKIISLVKKQEPRAKIFVVPNPSYGNAALRPTFNQAVKYMSTIFDNVYYLDIDESLYNDKDTFIKRNLVANHYTPAAYQYIASYIMSLMTDVIYNNPSEFYFVNLIGTEYQDPQ